MRKKNKKVFIIPLTIIAIVLIIVGIFVVTNNKKYEYKLLEISDEQIQYYKLQQNGKYGVIDKEGNLIIEAKYNSVDIPNPTMPIFIVSDDGKNFIALDSNGSKKYEQYDNVEAISINLIASNVPYEKSVLKYKQDGLYGIIDLEGNKITENIYDSITNIDYKEGNLKVEKNGKFGVINIKGTTIIEPEYDTIISDGYYDEEEKYENAGFVLRIKTDDGYRFGYANRKGKIILETLYNEISRITELEGKDVYLIVSNNGRYGLIKNGKEIIKSEYTDINFDKNNNLLIVKKDKTYGAINIEGDNIIPIDYDNIIVGGKHIEAQKGEEIIIFDAEGKKLDTDIISYNKVNDNYAIIINKDNKYNIVDSNNNKKLRETYTYIEHLEDNYFIVTKNGETGIIDSDGKIIVELKYSAMQKIDKTNVIQAIDITTNRTDIIDENMNIHEGLENAYISKRDEYIKLYSENDVRYYDLTGKEKTYKQLYPNNQIYAVKNNGKWGLANSSGDIIVPCEFDMVTEQNVNVAGVKKDGKWQIVNLDGKLTSNKQYTISWLDVMFLNSYYKTNSQAGIIVYSGE